MKKIKAIFCGTPDFALPTLQALCEHPYIELTHIITKISKPVGRGLKITPPPVVEFAIEKKIPFTQTENINKDHNIEKLMQDEAPHLLIVLAFSQFLSNKILNWPTIGAFNIHASLLPLYRGAAPIQFSILKGDTQTGVCIQKMVKKMDAGDVAISLKTSIEPNETAGELSSRLKILAADIIKQFIENLVKGQMTFTQQDETLATYAPTLSKEDGLLDFMNQSASEIHNRVRGLSPWPGTYFFLNQTRTKVIKVNIFDKPVQKKFAAGEIIIFENKMLVQCKDKIIHLQEIQFEGKRVMSDNQFLQGHHGELKVTSKT